MTKISTLGGPDALSSLDLSESIGREIGGSVQEVQAVMTAFDDDEHLLQVWSIVPTRDRDVYRKVYAKEKEIIHRFDGIDIDFHVVPSHGRDPATLVTGPNVHPSFLRD